MPNPALQISQTDGVTVITLGRQLETLNELALDKLSDDLYAAVEEADPPRVVIDMPNTKFFGSSYIEVLFRCWNRVSARDDGKFALSALTPYCAEIISVARLDGLWSTFPSCEEAVSAMKE